MKVYEVSFDHDGNLYPKGPGEGLSYFGGYLFPEFRCGQDREAAEKLAAAMNLAFKEGFKAKEREIQKVLGL